MKRTWPEVKCLLLTSSRRERCTLRVSKVIYHKFSHGAAFYTLNGEYVNVMLEFNLTAEDILLSPKWRSHGLGNAEEGDLFWLL